MPINGVIITSRAVDWVRPQLSPTEPKYGGIFIRPAHKQIRNEPGCNQTFEGNSIAAISKRKIGAIATRWRPDISQTILCFTKRSRPGTRAVQKQSPETTPQNGVAVSRLFSSSNSVSAWSSRERGIFAADRHGATIVGLPCIKVGSGGFPHKAAVRPSPEKTIRAH